MKAKLMKAVGAVSIIVIALVVYNMLEDYMEKRAAEKAAAAIIPTAPVEEVA